MKLQTQDWRSKDENLWTDESERVSLEQLIVEYYSRLD